MGDWTSLPHHLLDLILEKIGSPVDYLQFGATCVSWHSVAQVNRDKVILSSSDHQVPMLLVHSNRQRKAWRVYDVMRNKFLQSQQLLPKGCVRFSGSSKGWLANVNDDYSVTLHRSFLSNIDHDHNPEIAPSICLPSLFPPELNYAAMLESLGSPLLFPPCDYHIHMVLLTTDPLINPNDCTVVVIFGEFNDLAFIRLGRDTSWTQIKGDHDWSKCFDNVLYHNNKFYAITYLGAIISFDIPESGSPIVRLVLHQHEPVTGKRYLVTSPGGELWYIARVTKWPRTTKMFKVFRLEDVDGDDAKLVKIKSLGDVALFLGDNSAISVVASNHLGCQANTIHFAHDITSTCGWYTSHISDFGIYEVKSRRIKFHYNMSSFTLSLMSNRQPIWVVPPLVDL